jgi:hypothetical protein
LLHLAFVFLLRCCASRRLAQQKQSNPLHACLACFTAMLLSPSAFCYAAAQAEGGKTKQGLLAALLACEASKKAKQA